MRRAYLDRARFLGDPDFVQIPLTSCCQEHARTPRRRSIRQGSSSASSARHSHEARYSGPDETTTFSAIDREGVAVSNTYTLEGGDGSHVVFKGAVFLAEQRDGGLPTEPRRDAGETALIGTPATSSPRQADAQLDDADHRGRREARSC